MYAEDDYVSLSALQHLAFCPRQCALIHLEQQWVENFLTAEGRVMHDRAHDEGAQIRKDVRIERGTAVSSVEFGLSGKADVIEYHYDKIEQREIPFPIEYKHGKPKADDTDLVQLCAQTLCLEEMLGISIPAGAFYYGKTRHRLEVIFSAALRQRTKQAISDLHSLIQKGQTPHAKFSKKCEACSLIEVCLPKTISSKFSVNDYIIEQLKEA